MALPIVTLLAVTFLIGMHSSGRIAGKVRNFYIAGNITPFWVLALSLCGQAIELAGTQENLDASMVSFWRGAVYPVGIGISLVLIGLFFARPMHGMHLLTLPDFYFRRYGQKVELLTSVICLISFVILAASNLAAVGILLEGLLGLPAQTSLIGVAAIITCYTLAGGLFAVTWNDILHVGVAVIGFIGALLWSLAHYPTEVIWAAVETRLSWQPFYSLDQGAPQLWASLLALGLGDIVALDFMERVFAAKSADGARLSCLLSGAMTIGAGLMMSFLAMVGAEATQGTDFTSFASHFPDGIRMMFFLGLIGLCISTLDGAIMACTTVITKNVVQQSFPQLVPQNRLLLFSRLATLPVALLATLLAIAHPTPGALLVLAFDAVFAGCLVPLVAGIYWKKANAVAAFWAILIPSLLRLFFYFLGPQNWAALQTLIPPAVSLALMASLSLIGTSGRRSSAA